MLIYAKCKGPFQSMERTGKTNVFFFLDSRFLTLPWTSVLLTRSGCSFSKRTVALCICMIPSWWLRGKYHCHYMWLSCSPDIGKNYLWTLSFCWEVIPLLGGRHPTLSPKPRWYLKYHNLVALILWGFAQRRPIGQYICFMWTKILYLISLPTREFSFHMILGHDKRFRLLFLLFI